ncbi:MAG TPA: sulfotransferase, partial [Acidimicrobiia bacterium]|nr:sulfotransferase [Acidimicrobiia bacterium]
GSFLSPGSIAMTRLPDFLIIGAMKAGTTSLYRWLESTGAVVVPSDKEPHFFSREWDRGIDWYASSFAHLAPEHPTGEASVSYTDPQYATAAAERIRNTIPDVKLIFLARNPAHRLRSHYRHELQRNREHRPFAVAVADPDSAYLRCSLYSRALEPYSDLFDPSQLLIVEFEDLVRGGGFARVLTHLGLEGRPRPPGDYNITEDKRRFTAAARWLFDKGLTAPLSRLPGPLRQLGRALGTRSDLTYRSTLAESHTVPLPEDVVRLLVDDVARLESMVGRQFPWELTD